MLHILPAELEAYVQRRFADALTARTVTDAAERVLPGRAYREGSRAGGEPSDPTGRAVADAEADAVRDDAWRGIVASVLADLDPRAADALGVMWGAGQPREVAAMLFGASEGEVFVWEQQASARAAIRAAVDGLLQ